MNFWGGECLGWWTSHFTQGVVNVWGGELLGWWMSGWWTSYNPKFGDSPCSSPNLWNILHQMRGFNKIITKLCDEFFTKIVTNYPRSPSSPFQKTKLMLNLDFEANRLIGWKNSIKLNVQCLGSVVPLAMFCFGCSALEMNDLKCTGITVFYVLLIYWQWFYEFFIGTIHQWKIKSTKYYIRRDTKNFRGKTHKQNFSRIQLFVPWQWLLYLVAI